MINCGNHLFIDQLVVSANKAVAGNLCVQCDILNQHRAFKEQIYLKTLKGKEIMKFTGKKH